MAVPHPHHHYAKAGSETRFWAMVAVVLALVVQLTFPPHLMAATPGNPGFLLCNTDDPVVDRSLNAAVAAEKAKTAEFTGLKCADCVLASLAGLPQPDLSAVPVVYRTKALTLRPSRADERPQARAPPRPHSCGPPHFV